MSAATSANPQHVVIFGGAGFIGRHMTEWFLQSGEARVTIADIVTPNWEPPAGCRFAECDVRQTINLETSDPDLIVNLAAIHRTPGHPDHEYHETNESGARNVNEFAAATGCKTIWFTSSIAVYGPTEDAVTENSEPRPVSAYGKSKLKAEKIHREWASAHAGRKLVIARPATVFGQGEGGNFTRLAKALSRRAFFYPGRKDTLKACGYVKDLAPSFAFMQASANPTMLFNFAYPQPPTIEEVCSSFSKAGSLPTARVVIPSKLLLGAGSVLYRLGVGAVNPERIQKLMHSTNVVGAALAESGYEFEFALDPALADWFESEPVGFD